MTERRGISFQQLRRVCDRRYAGSYRGYKLATAKGWGCIDVDNTDDSCNPQNCPVWRRLAR